MISIGEYTQNVPLSVTYATSPAVEISGFDIMSFGDCDIICLGSAITGDVCVWNVERQLEKCANFNIKSCEKNIMKHYKEGSEVNINLLAMCTFKKETITKLKELNFDKCKSNSISGTRIVAGVKCYEIETHKKQAFELASPSLYLVSYAVVEAYKSSSTNKVATFNGNDNESLSSHANGKNGSQSLITILESTYEERIDGFDDILKFIDSKDKSASKTDSLMTGGPKNDHTWTFVSKTESSEIDSVKSSAMNGPSIALKQNVMQTPEFLTKNKSENELVCFPMQAIEITDIDNGYEIKEVLTSSDNHYMIVFLKSCSSVNNNDCMETDNVRNDEMVQSQILVYEIDEKGLIKEQIVSRRMFINDQVPIEFCILPKFDTNERFFSGCPTDSNAFVITCLDGSIKVLSIKTLNTLSEANVQGENFISCVYCKNLERLCASTANGTLHFYSFYDLDNDSSDEIDDEVINSTESIENKYKRVLPSTSNAYPKVECEKNSKIEIIANRKSLNLNDLKLLYSLTQFDESLSYSAEVPGCWTEIFQAKRRHPQNMSPSEDTHLTRTWRLHNDATTWDEHLIELSLPKPPSIGHIDFKFSILQPCNNPPAIQVTLLKQKSIGLCCRRKQGSNIHSDIEPSIDVDNNINFNLNSGPTQTNTFYNNSVIENPVLSEEYLQARNAEILVGPIELSACMDLNEQGGTVTFISPKLLKSKARNYLIHLKTMTDVSKDGQSKTKGE
jgi:baculoviral IAP repeat-containing protein 6